MLGLNQMKKFMYLGVFLVSLSFASFAQGNAEVSAHFGVKLGSTLNLEEVTSDENNFFDQKATPFQLGADVLYRHMMGDTGSFGVGLRYRIALTGEKDYEATNATTDKYKLTHHRVALLANYRFHVNQFFVGPVLGIDIWKSLAFYGINIPGSGDGDHKFSSNQFLWNQITGHLGLELGYQITDNLLVKLEGGYDLSSFGDLECRFTGRGNTDEAVCNPNPLQIRREAEDNTETEKFELNGFYATLGIGWFFG